MLCVEPFGIPVRIILILDSRSHSIYNSKVFFKIINSNDIRILIHVDGFYIMNIYYLLIDLLYFFENLILGKLIWCKEKKMFGGKKSEKIDRSPYCFAAIADFNEKHYNHDGILLIISHVFDFTVFGVKAKQSINSNTTNTIM